MYGNDNAQNFQTLTKDIVYFKVGGDKSTYDDSTIKKWYKCLG